MSQSSARGSSHSAISVVNALATGKGAAIGIALKCAIRVSLVPKKRLNESGIIIKTDFIDHHRLIEACKAHAERFFGLTIPENKALSVAIDSEIPSAVGLKSSSAVSIACIKALSELFSKTLDPISILNISCRASKDSRASITGAYDDAAACLFGGIVLANNLKSKLLDHGLVPPNLGNIVLIRLPRKEKKYTSSVDLRTYFPFRLDSLKALEYAKYGKICSAMLLNSIIQCAALGYSFRPVSSAIEEGASASGISGKGPAIAALCRTQKLARSLEKRWREEAEAPITILRTRVVQPQSLMKN